MSQKGVVITGVGLITPLGRSPCEVLDRIGRGECAAARAPFSTRPYACDVCARVADFDAELYFPGNKTLRMMNRDAQMAVAAARLAMRDSGLQVDPAGGGEDIALFGATGLAGLPVEEAQRLVEHSAGADGGLDLRRLGEVALKRVRPVLSFKILSNMPICFVSIFENIHGENAVYTPWEGQGAQAIAAGVRAIRHGRAPAALVGGCDVKTHEFAFINLQQMGAFESWRRCGAGTVPGEGAAFMVLEDEALARGRGARIYARLADHCLGTVDGEPAGGALGAVVAALGPVRDVETVIAAGDGDAAMAEAEASAMARVDIHPRRRLHPKQHVGNLFAAAAAVQVALAAEAVRGGHVRALANCFGIGGTQAAFVLEGA